MIFVNFLGWFCQLIRNIQFEAECAGSENIRNHTNDGQWEFRGDGCHNSQKVKRESLKLSWKFQGGGEYHPWWRFGNFLQPHNPLLSHSD